MDRILRDAAGEIRIELRNENGAQALQSLFKATVGRDGARSPSTRAVRPRSKVSAWPSNRLWPHRDTGALLVARL